MKKTTKIFLIASATFSLLFANHALAATVNSNSGNKNIKENLPAGTVLVSDNYLPGGGNPPSGGGNPPGTGTAKLENPLKGIDSIPDLIQTILKGLLKIGIPVVALAIVYSGFLFVAARGNSEKLDHAKETLMYTLIGAAVLLGSWAIAEIISATITGLGA